MKQHTDYEFLRVIADIHELYDYSDTFSDAQIKQLKAIADQIESLSNTDAKLTAVVFGTCMHPITYSGPHVAVGNVIYCSQCAGPTVVADVRCAMVDPPVT